jgi:uncharacterized repeat protein (TIGR01451 family)
MKINQETHNPATAMQKALRFLKTPARRMLLTAGAGLALSMISPAQAAAPDMKTLLGHVPAIVSRLTPVDDLNATNRLHLAIGLPLRNAEALTNLLAQIYDPASTNYHHYLTPEQFTAQFGPTEEDYAKVINFAQANGLTVAGTHPNRLVLDVQSTVADVEKTFHVKMRNFHHPKEDRTFYAPDTDPTVSAALPILHISGMDNYYLMRPKSNPQPISSITNFIPNAGTGPQGTYMGADLRKAYVPGTTLTGVGQNVGLLQFDGYYPSDPAAYAQQNGLTNPPNLVNIPIDGGVSRPGPGNTEVAMDIEMIMAMAPGVSNIYVYEAPNPSPWVDILSRMANDNLARQLSCSWGGGPPDAAAEQIFQQMALQGQTFFNAVGDTDAFTEDNPIDFPSDSPNITQVGGTVLTTTGSGDYQSEEVWNDRFPRPPGDQGSSGGISTYYPIPTWQQGLNMTNNHGSQTFRNTPDVALTAENIFIISDAGQPSANGGTSAAAPLWAAFTALANQQAATNGHAFVGFLNPAIYALAKTTNYNNVFRDVTVGDNFWPGSPTNFPAVPGYDLCTGLGSPNGTNLINALTAVGVTNPIVHITPPPPPYGSTLANLNGGNPNGTWQLFVQDDTAFNSGIISNGWILTLTTANPVGLAADLELTMDASASTIIVSNSVTYTLTVTNYGPSISSNVLVADKLPVGVIVVSSTISQGSLTGLNWNVGTLSVGAGARMVLTVQPLAVGSLLNYATAAAATPDANSDNDFASATVNVIIPAPPQLSGAYVGGNGAFQFTVTSDPGVTNIIQASTNLTTWIPIYTNIGSFIYTNLDATNYPQRFYRTLTMP